MIVQKYNMKEPIHVWGQTRHLMPEMISMFPMHLLLSNASMMLLL